MSYMGCMGCMSKGLTAESYVLVDLGGLDWTWLEFGGVRGSAAPVKVQSNSIVGSRSCDCRVDRLSLFRRQFVFVFHSLFFIFAFVFLYTGGWQVELPVDFLSCLFAMV